MKGRFYCERCDHDFDGEEARCPRCLRKSTVVDRRAQALAAIASRDENGGDIDRALLLLRIVLVALQLAVLLPLGWLTLEHGSWLSDHGLNLSVGAAMMAWGFFTLQLGFRMRSMMSSGPLTVLRVVRGQLGCLAFTAFQTALVVFAGWLPVAVFGPELDGWAHLVSFLAVWVLSLVAMVVVFGRVFQWLKRLSPSFAQWADKREADPEINPRS